jgi:hypothetical protein
MLRRSLFFASPPVASFLLLPVLTARALFGTSWQKAWHAAFDDLCLHRRITSGWRECGCVSLSQRSEATQRGERILAYEATAGAERRYSARGTGQACAQLRRWQASSSTFRSGLVEGAKQGALATKRSQPTTSDYDLSLPANVGDERRYSARGTGQACASSPRTQTTSSTFRSGLVEGAEQGALATQQSQPTTSGYCVERGHERVCVCSEVTSVCVCVARSRACVVCVSHVEHVVSLQLRFATNSKILKILNFQFPSCFFPLKKISGVA